MKAFFTLLFLCAFIRSSFAQVPNGNFEDWEIINDIEQPQHWKTNNYLCCIAVEKTDNAIEGDYSMKVSSTAPSLEGTGPGEATVTFHSDELYSFLNAAIKIDSIETGGSIKIKVLQWANGAFQEIGIWQDTNTTNGIVPISIPLNHSQPDSLKITIYALNTPGPTWSIGYSEVVIDNLEMVLSTASSDLENVEGALIVHPNPSTHTIYYHLPQGIHMTDLSLIDISGKKYFPEKTSEKVNLSNIPPGMYFLHITASDGRSYVEKICRR